jgi:hypothetical protein
MRPGSAEALESYAKCGCRQKRMLLNDCARQLTSYTTRAPPCSRSVR